MKIKLVMIFLTGIILIYLIEVSETIIQAKNCKTENLILKQKIKYLQNENKINIDSIIYLNNNVELWRNYSSRE